MFKQSPIIRLKDLILMEIEEIKVYLLGRILTIIDASVPNVEQRKGIKDLIRHAIHSEEGIKWRYYHIGRMLLEFNKKFSNSSLSPEEETFLETGRYSVIKEQQPVSKEYFTNS